MKRFPTMGMPTKPPTFKGSLEPLNPEYVGRHRTGSQEVLQEFEINRSVRCGDKLGKGAQGTAYSATLEDSNLSRSLVLKGPVSNRELHIHQLVCEGAKSRFSFHIVTALGASPCKAQQGLLMTQMTGGDLARYVPILKAILNDSHDNVGHVVVFQLIYRIMLQALIALMRCAQCGVVHRDVKAENFFVDDDLNLFLADFGVAWCATHPEFRYGFGGNSLYFWDRCDTPEADIYALGYMLRDLLGCPLDEYAYSTPADISQAKEILKRVIKLP